MDITGASAIVTGGASGLGEATSRLLAERGAKVVVLDMSDDKGNGYLIEMDRIKYRDGGINGIQKDQDVMLSLPFDAFYDSTTGRGLRITRAVAA